TGAYRERYPVSTSNVALTTYIGTGRCIPVAPNEHHCKRSILYGYCCCAYREAPRLAAADLAGGGRAWRTDLFGCAAEPAGTDRAMGAGHHRWTGVYRRNPSLSRSALGGHPWRALR